MGLDCRPGRHSPGVQCRALTDLDRDVPATSIQFCPERIGLVERDRLLGFIMGSEHARRFTRREHATAHVALLAWMVSGSENFFEHLGPIPYRLSIHLQNDMLNDCRPDAFVSESESDRPIAAVELEDWPDCRAHLLALHVSSVTGDTH